ncbi:MAG: phosphatidylglycerol lysyltransferase [Treponema sp.]|jgi:phosphoglucomutase|nr:phosphatidylglycerol lysyltransferase [Treponema sp.]
MAILPLREDDPGLDEAFLDSALGHMILSPSGWRGVFAENGDEESSGGGISAVHQVIVAVGAKVFADYIKTHQVNKPGKTKEPEIIIGMDTRPTGTAIADVMIRTLLAERCALRFAFITAAPEIMAYTRAAGANGDGNVQGFVYISASHNPIGHNGLKFGRIDGGVLPPAEANILIDTFRSFMAFPHRIAKAVALINHAAPETLAQVYARAPQVKQDVYSAYLRFTGTVITGATEAAAQDNLLGIIAQGIQDHPIGVVADFNGSARTLSIDREFLSSLGVKFYGLNDRPGEIAHRIVPEGDSLEPCRQFLETIHQKDPAVMLGYVPDCDGDRGNLVIWDAGERQARILEAQEVFALACVSELAHLVWTGELRYDTQGNALHKVALAVNDPTSLRIDRIAQAFDVSVFRAEVGEANVVGLARKLREQGYTVRILGEGSAGGNITHPSAVRDPIDTVMAIVKLLAIRSTGEKKGFFEHWCDRSGRTKQYRTDFSLADIITALPAFVTTGSYTPAALLQVTTSDHGVLKDRYQKVFLREWEARKAELKTRYHISGWEARAYIGMEEKRDITRFGDAGRGGLKIIFTDTGDNPLGWIWMRGSGTEPVFRVMADAEGSDKRIERDLIEWQRRMVIEADSAPVQ